MPGNEERLVRLKGKPDENVDPLLMIKKVMRLTTATFNSEESVKFQTADP